MDLELHWHPPVILEDGFDSDLFYNCDPESVPASAGVYVFSRLHGGRVEPMYIGRTTNLRKRIFQHLYGNVPLMKRIMTAKSGARAVLVGEWCPKPGQRAQKALPVIEGMLIKDALSQGYELFNDKGTKTPVHKLKSVGNSVAHRRLFRRTMFGAIG